MWLQLRGSNTRRASELQLPGSDLHPTGLIPSPSSSWANPETSQWILKDCTPLYPLWTKELPLWTSSTALNSWLLRVSWVTSATHKNWVPHPPKLTHLLTPASEKAMAPHSSTLGWKIPWTEEPGGLQSMGSLGVGHDWATSLSLFTFMHWRRKWQPTPAFLPGESQGWGSLVGCHLWGRTESDMTDMT